MKIAVLGANGMLGSVVFQYLESEGLDVTPFYKTDINARVITQSGLNKKLKGYEWVINCIGMIKPRITPTNTEDAILVNSLFPYKLSKVPGIKVIQIATDCVYSGTDGDELNETHIHDPEDVYGMTKSLGEVVSGTFYNIRCSIIGRKEGNKSLMEWFLGQEKGAKVKGYTNHYWNGITTLAFAKICLAIMKQNNYPLIDQHIIPLNSLNKYQLLMAILEIYNRQDIEIEPVSASSVCDRELFTVHSRANRELWKKAGYEGTPTIYDLIRELKQAEEKGVLHD